MRVINEANLSPEALSELESALPEHGTVAAVAVWNHKPNADELLAARLKTGWQATPSLLRDGAQVLGAACPLH